MIKKPIRKLQVPRETIRIMSNEQLHNIAGGLSNRATCSLTDTGGPFPSQDACGPSLL